jgi:hypothetical protein
MLKLIDEKIMEEANVKIGSVEAGSNGTYNLINRHNRIEYS